MGNEGHSVNMRRDIRTGEHLAVFPSACVNRRTGVRFYLALCESDGCYAELTPEYLAKRTRTVADFPGDFKRYVDRRIGYLLNLAPRLYG